MFHKFLHPEQQRGDITLILAVMTAIVIGTVVYFNFDQLNNQQRSDRREAQRDSAETLNLSALSQATALMQYRGNNPKSEDANTLPYLYPDPYLPLGLNLNTNSPIGKIRDPGASANWDFNAMKLDIASPDVKKLSQNAFKKAVNDGIFPTNSSTATLRFLQAIRSSNPSTPYLIEKYSVEVTRMLTDGSLGDRQVTNLATVDVPLIKPPSCKFSSINGNKFQPNASMQLRLEVWGVATKIYYPSTTELLNDGNCANMTSKNIYAQASSISGGAKVVHTWTVTAPRQLDAVDNTGEVPFSSKVCIEGPTQSGTVAECKFDYKIVAPATCKLWTNKARIDPGQCVDIKAGYLGNVATNSLTLKARNAADPAGQSVTGITHNAGASTARFCPAQNGGSDGTTVPANEAETYADTIASLNPTQRQAVMFAMKEHADRLRLAFPDDSVLHSLTINQTNGLFELSTSQVEDIANLDFDDFDALESLTGAQRNALRKPANNNAILGLPFTELKSAEILKNVSTSILRQLETYNPILLAAFIENTNTVLNTAVNYIIEGTVKDYNGVTNTCQTTLTVGPNNCPLYGPNFPNICRDQTLWVIHGTGTPEAQNYRFCPGKKTTSSGNSSWEVAGIADSPVSSYPCPPDSRCYAVEGYEPRTPFVRVDNAAAANCSVTTLNRHDLGCFRKGTVIRMADGSSKPINQLTEGEMVYNPLRKQGFAIRRITAGMEAYPLIEIKLETGAVHVTREHAFVTKAGIKTAENLRNEDEIIQENGSF